jgi:hypothetical protein
MKNILQYFLVTIVVIISYFFVGKENYKATLPVHLYALVFPILILMTDKKLNIYTSLFLYSLLLWHIIDISAEYLKQK